MRSPSKAGGRSGKTSVRRVMLGSRSALQIPYADTPRPAAAYVYVARTRNCRRERAVERFSGWAVGERRILLTAKPPNRPTALAAMYTATSAQKIQPRSCHAIQGAMYGTRLIPHRLPP